MLEQSAAVVVARVALTVCLALDAISNIFIFRSTVTHKLLTYLLAFLLGCYIQPYTSYFLHHRPTSWTHGGEISWGVHTMKQICSKLRAHVVQVYFQYICFMFASSCKHPIKVHTLWTSIPYACVESLPHTAVGSDAPNRQMGFHEALLRYRHL